MIWLTWRQFRPQAAAAAIALAVTATVLAATRPAIAAGYTASGLPACHAGCAGTASIFVAGLGSFDHILYFGGIASMYLAPALMGLFWGAPLIAREVETRTASPGTRASRAPAGPWPNWAWSGWWPSRPPACSA
jgi:hypothetical protein